MALRPNRHSDPFQHWNLTLPTQTSIHRLNFAKWCPGSSKTRWAHRFESSWSITVQRSREIAIWCVSSRLRRREWWKKNSILSLRNVHSHKNGCMRWIKHIFRSQCGALDTVFHVYKVFRPKHAHLLKIFRPITKLNMRNTKNYMQTIDSDTKLIGSPFPFSNSSSSPFMLFTEGKSRKHRW